jgi:hypothetical protein
MKATDWIPAEMRIPDEETPVLCFDTTEGGIVIGYIDDGKWWSDYTRIPIEVSHWQELPPHPESGAVYRDGAEHGTRPSRN